MAFRSELIKSVFLFISLALQKRLVSSAYKNGSRVLKIELQTVMYTKNKVAPKTDH